MLLCELCVKPLNHASLKMMADSNLSAHHVTTVTDAGGLAFIRPAEGRKSFRVHQCEFAEERLQGLHIERDKSGVFKEIPAQSAKLCLNHRPGTQ